MAWAIVQSAEGTSTSATVTAAFSVTPTAGNLVVLAFASDDYNGTPNTGWTQSTGMEQQTFHGGYIWWRVSDGGNSLQYTIGSGTNSAWVLLEISGADASPYDISAGQFAQSSGGSYTTANLTPSTGSRLLVAMIGGSQNSAVDMSPDFGTWTNSFTHARSSGPASASGTRDCLGVGYREVAGDGSTAFSTGANYPVGTTPTSRSGLIIAFKAATGGGGISGTASIAEAGDTTSSAGTVALTGVSAPTEAGDTISGTSTVALKGASVITEAGDTVSSAATLTLKGVLTATEEGDTTSATGALQATATGTAAITEADDTVSILGTIALKGVLGLSDESDIVSATIAASSRAGVLDVTEAGDTVSASSTLRLVATASIIEASDTTSFTGAQAIFGTASITEAGDTVSAAAVPVLLTTPQERIAAVPTENRRATVAVEIRTASVRSENRSVSARAETRRAVA